MSEGLEKKVRGKMKKTVFWIYMIAAVAAAAPVAAADGDETRPSIEAVRHKYIWFGWDTQCLSAEQVLDNAESFDKSVYDGTPVTVKVKNPETGKEMKIHDVLENPEVTDAMLADKIPVLKEIVSHRGLRESLISSFYTPKKRVAWTDDATWAKAARSFGAIARAARSAGMKGLFFDQEEYHKNEKQFTWREGDPEFDECARLARRRGAELFREVFRAYPNAVVLSCYGMLSACMSFDYFGADDIYEATRQHRDLWPHFYNGMLDVAPWEAKLVDGSEVAYEYRQSREEFAKSAACIKVRGVSCVSPENRKKYSAVSQASFGFFINAYVKTNETARFWYGPHNGSRLGQFDDNLWGATQWSDEYVWLYAGGFAGIHWRNKSGTFNDWKTPNDLLPGYDEVVFANKDPVAWFHRRVAALAASGGLTNLYAKKVGDAIKPDKENEKKVFGVIDIPGTKAGEWYGFRFRARGDVGSVVRWLERGLKYRPFGARILPVVTAKGRLGTDGWRQDVGVIRIPMEGVTPSIVFSGVHEGTAKAEVDGLEIYRLFNPRDFADEKVKQEK